MSKDFNPKSTRSQTLLSLIEGVESTDNNIQPGTSYEVFRNNTTAVEVIVKEVQTKTRKKIDAVDENFELKALKDVNEVLTSELKKSNSVLVRTKNGYKMIFAEMKKQLDDANRREAEMQVNCLNFQIENAKLKSLLESKTNLVIKFKRELNNLKRVTKLVIKGISFAPAEEDSYLFGSQADYREFEKDLKKDCNGKAFDGATTFDSSISKTYYYSGDKHI